MAAKLSIIKNKREKKKTSKPRQQTKKKKEKKDHSDITTHTLTQLHLF